MKLLIPALLALSTTATAQTLAEPYRALGTEPFWSLTIDGRTMRLARPGEPSLVLPAPMPRPSFNGRRYVTPRMTVEITAAPCSDGMSDRRYPERVTVIMGRTTLRGCGGAALDTPVASARLEGGTWTIAAIDGRRVALDRAEVRFTGGTIAGNAGCNRFSAQYTLAGDVMLIGMVRATRMVCPNFVMDVENRVMAALGKPIRVRWIGRATVVLGTRDGGVVLRRAVP